MRDEGAAVLRDGAAFPSDPVERARALHEVYDAVLSGAATGTVPRSLVSDSWRRSLAAHVDPDPHAPAPPPATPPPSSTRPPTSTGSGPRTRSAPSSPCCAAPW